jgi:hypothetical protein
MRAELKSLPAEQLREYIVDLRGIEYADDWSEARPVTLMTILEEALANHPEVLWIVELKDAQTAQECEQDEQESVQIAQESAQHEPEAAEEEPEEPKEEGKPVKHESASNLGEWAEYQGRALSTSEQNFVIKHMRDEGYSFSVIATVVRLSGPTVSSRYKKLCEEAEDA